MNKNNSLTQINALQKKYIKLINEDIDTKYDETNVILDFNDNEYEKYQYEKERIHIINSIVNNRRRVYKGSEYSKLDHKDMCIIDLKKQIKLLEDERINLIIQYNNKIDELKLENKKELINLKKKFLNNTN